ncbi:MAG: hypothetical protein ABIS01_16775, partial [Ferruginibacter sp.]
MQTLTTSEKVKNSAGVAVHKNRQQPFFAPIKVQPKLTIGPVDDPYEREADAVAEKVMRMPANETEPAFFQLKSLQITPVQRKCTACADEEKLQRKGDED